MPGSEETLKPGEYPTAGYVKLGSMLEDKAFNYLACTEKSPFDDRVVDLVMSGDKGQRVIFSKVTDSESRNEGMFLQDWCLSIHPGSDESADFKQIDYNFNEKHDGKLRIRYIKRNQDPRTESVPLTTVDDDKHIVMEKAETALYNATQATENMMLEEDMGLNNLPVTSEQLKELNDYLGRCNVLNPHEDYTEV